MCARSRRTRPPARAAPRELGPSRASYGPRARQDAEPHGAGFAARPASTAPCRRRWRDQPARPAQGLCARQRRLGRGGGRRGVGHHGGNRDGRIRRSGFGASALAAGRSPDRRAVERPPRVKPWFNGRMDLAPPVIDLTAQGFTLIGGRLDFIDGKPVAAIVYRRRVQVINLFVMQGLGAAFTAPRLEVIAGIQYPALDRPGPEPDGRERPRAGRAGANSRRSSKRRQRRSAQADNRRCHGRDAPGHDALRNQLTFFIRPQVLIADQMPRSSRKRSIGADDLIEAMR